jgi:hypothetical protein
MAALGNWLFLAPLGLIFAILLAGLCISAWIGRYVRQKLGPVGAKGKDEETDQADLVVSSVMGLLALLVGFTFALAIDRYDTRRANVVTEANAIGTTYLRTQLLDEPHRARLSRLLIEYTDNRIALAQSGPGPKFTELLKRNDSLLTDLWTATVAAFPSMRPYDFSSSYLETMNQMIDMDSVRKAGRRAHVPPPVFALLFLYQFVTAAVLGYVMVGKNGRWGAVFLLFLFALAVIFVIDIDRPVGGAIQESQEPMLWLQASLHANPPEVYDRLNEPLPARGAPH